MRIEGIRYANPNTFAALNTQAVNETPRVFRNLSAATGAPVQQIHSRPLLEHYQGVSAKLDATIATLRGQTTSPLKQLDVASGRTPPGEFQEAMQGKSLGKLARLPAVQAGRQLNPDLVEITQEAGTVTVRMAPLSNGEIQRRLMGALGAVPHG